jgi:hypothetical protein
MQPKPIFQSKTIVGAVLMILPLALQFFQVDIQQPDLDQAGHDLGAAVHGITGLVGFAMVVIGRYKAKRPISLSGK